MPERKKTAGDNGGGDDVEARRFLIKGGTREGMSKERRRVTKVTIVTSINGIVKKG